MLLHSCRTRKGDDGLGVGAAIGPSLKHVRSFVEWLHVCALSYSMHERREEPVQRHGLICFGGELGQEPGGAVLVLWVW